MDRNRFFWFCLGTRVVALRKESVDRNLFYGDDLTFADGSLSARRAWIEIGLNFARKIRPVASLSARRAWIEMLYQLYDTYAKVSLSARRAWIEILICLLSLCVLPGRSPQGERG